MSDQSTLERLALDAGPHDAVDLSGALQQSDFAAEAEAQGGTTEQPEAPSFQPIPVDLFLERWIAMHAMMGGLLSPRGGPSCDLAGLAMDPGGQEAGKAFYRLCMTSSFTQRAFLSEEMGMLGSIAAVGMHGMACRAMIQDARAHASQRAQAEAMRVAA